MTQAATTITMSAGRSLELRELSQRLTYGGLLEGLPTRKQNKGYLHHLVAEQQAQQRIPVFLLLPLEMPIELPPGEVYPFGEPATLPRITCVARFRSRPIGSDDPIMNYSELIVIWLQAEFALPIEQSVRDQLSNLAWDSLASNFEY